MKLTSLPIVLRAFKRFPLARVLFVAIRSLVVPWECVVMEVRHSGTVIDIGCGDGVFLALLKVKHPELRAVGIEHDDRKIATARKCHQIPIEFYSWADLANVRLPAADYVTLTDVLYAVALKDWDGIFRFAHEHLKPGGTFIIKDTIDRPRWKTWLTLVEEIVATRILRYTKGGPPHLHAPGIFLDSLERNGFECLHHRRLDRGYLWPHYLFVARKN